MNNTQTHDPVEHPVHYTRGGIETIDFIEAKGMNFARGNAIKYLSRAGHKGDELEDLRKAQWYLEREIERVAREVDRVERITARERVETCIRPVCEFRSKLNTRDAAHEDSCR